MAKYKAIHDTMYNFALVKKGKIIYGGDELKSNEHFELVGDENKTLSAGDNGAGVATPDSKQQMNFNQLVKYAQSIGVEGANRMKKPELLAAIAAKEAETAAPKADEVVTAGGKDGNVDGDGVNEVA